MIIIEIPCKSYIRCWIEKQYGKPAKISKSNNVGKFLYQLMSDPQFKNDSDYRPYRDIVTVSISEDVFLRKGYYITKTNTTLFNNFVEEQIKSTLFVYIDALKDGTGKIKTKLAIEKALEKFGFGADDWPYESIKKAYDRHRKRVNVSL